MEIQRLSFLLHVYQFLHFFTTASTNPVCSFNGCYDSQRNPRPCMASPVNMAFRRNVTATNTCGRPKGGFCELGPGNNCYECDANNTNKRHPASLMVDREFDSPYNLDEITWWQSQTWWETNNLGLSDQRNALEVNITLSFGKSFHISGGIIVRFNSRRPKAMFLEKSKDFGRTWRVLQYFASDCSRYFGMSDTVGVPQNDPFAVTCTMDYSGQFPQRFGKVEFRFDSRYEPGCGYFEQDVQDFMLATNVRVRLEYPATDGLEVIFQEEDILNKYYYAIADIVVTGRCNCNGHAKYCTGERMDETCECEHNTMGADCEMCMPLYNNRPWMPANSSHANECQECQCNSHALSCVYNENQGNSECANCQHNTEGLHCESCLPMYYRDSSVPLDDVNTCVVCNCFADGITNDGVCLQEATPTTEAGQCQCKTNVFGRQCDQCVPGYWGFRLNPPGECQACGCNSLGTVNNTVQCDQYTGECPCKGSVQGRHCVECKDGFYFFPVRSDQECLSCPCDLGGAFPKCDKVSGTCSCRHGVEGTRCERSQRGRFFPALDFVRFEAESMTGTFTPLLPSQGYGDEFTGRGYASLLPEQYVWFQAVSSLASHWFHPVVRYSIPESCTFGSATKLVLRAESVNWNNSMEFEGLLDQLPHGLAQAWMIQETVPLLAGELSNFTLTYNTTDGGDNCSVLVDSLVFIPDVNRTRVYTESPGETRSRLRGCVRTALSQDGEEAGHCEALVFSASTEIYNGTLACGCDPTGSVTGAQCSVYGGQCQCRPGIVGRTCSHCDNTFYGFSSAGCTRCGCSSAGSVDATCDVNSGECSCKSNVQGHNCNSCKPGTFFLNAANVQGCLHCFGYGRALSCTSAEGYVSCTITTQFVDEINFNWTVVDIGDSPVSFSSSSRNGMVVTSPPSPPVVYIAAPARFIGDQLRSYGQRLHVTMDIHDPATGQNPSSAGGDVILTSGGNEVALNFIPSPSPNVTSYHVVLDETRVANQQSVSPLEFQSILANLTSLKIRATYYPSPHGSVTFKQISLDKAVSKPGAPEGEWVGFVENATCHVNYTGLSCEQCASGFTREVVGSGPFGRCVLCSCNNRSKECDGQTGACRNCLVGTFGDRCHLCTNNVLGPECSQCKPGYWGLSEDGCIACDCYLPGTELGNNTLCDQVTGQCMCNATSNIGGRRCDTCKENSWNTSAGRYSCQECPPCYASVQEAEILVRTRISSLQVQLTAIRNHPAMLHNQTFVQRLRQLTLAVSDVVQTTIRALGVESNSSSQWLRFFVAVNELNMKLNDTSATGVNHTLVYASIVETNRGETETCVTQIRDVIKAASHLLETPMRLALEHVETLSNSLGSIAVQIDNLVDNAIQGENQTLLANGTIHARVEHALNTASDAADMARRVFSSQAQMVSVLRSLHENASDVNALGEQTVAMVTERLVNASEAYNESAMTLVEASRPNSNRTSVLQDLIKGTSDATALATQYFNQTSRLYQSSVTVIIRVNAAIQTSVVLELEVQVLFSNATEMLASFQATHTAAQSAVSRASHVEESARRMLDVMTNFEAKSQQAQALASVALIQISSIKNVSRSIIRNASVVEHSAANSLIVAKEAVRVGIMVRNLSTNHQQVVDRAHVLAYHLMDQTAAVEHVVDNQTAQDLMAREIEPVQRLCRNMTVTASNASNNSVALLARAAQANVTAQRLIGLIKRVVNESSDLPGVNGDNIPTLRGEVRTVRQQFEGLQLGPELAELRRQLQVQREKVAQYEDRVRQLRSDITVRTRLLSSLASVAPC